MPARLYADDQGRRLRQVGGDALALAAIWVAVRVARWLAASVRELEVVADGLDSSGRTVRDAAGRAADAVDGVPVVGDTLASPFRGLGEAGDGLTTAGTRVGGAVDAVAFWLPVLLVVLVVGYVAFRYLPGRLRWIAEATEVARLLDDPAAARLLAHRAAVRPLRVLRRHLDDPATAFTEGRHAELAAVELRALGLSPTRLAAARPDAA